MNFFFLSYLCTLLRFSSANATESEDITKVRTTPLTVVTPTKNGLITVTEPIFKRSGLTVPLTLVHNGNMRAVFDEVKLPKGKDGTLSRLHAYLLHGRHPGRNMFYFNVGGSYMETFLHKVLSFHILTQVMNLLKPDAATLGLRAFAGTHDDLVKFVMLNYMFLSCNTNDTTRFLPYRTYDLGNGISMIVIGYISPQVNDFGPDINVGDPVEAIDKTLKSITVTKRLVVVMGCSDIETEQKIARNVKGIDIIIGEVTFPNLLSGYPMEISGPRGKILLLRTCSAMRNVGVFKATLNSDGKIVSHEGLLADMLNETRTSQNLTDLLEIFKPVMEKYDGEVIAKSRVNFNAQCRRYECNLGNLIADAFVEYKVSQYKGAYWTDTPIGLINAGSIREGVNIDVRNGELTRSDILNVLPYHEFLVTMTLKGDEIFKVIEKGMRNWETDDTKGSFLQVSGLRIICNKSLPKGNRVQYIKARCAECGVPTYHTVIPSAEYRIITNEYLAKGGDEYLSLKYGKDIVYEPITDVDAVMMYVQKYRIISTEIDERLGSIVFLNGMKHPPNYFVVTILCMFSLLINIHQE